MEFLRIARRGVIGTIVFDRPAALNAFDLAMFETLGQTLARWRDDPGIEAVVVRGNGRAFSAGGDIAAVRRAAIAGDGAANDRNYLIEYSLNALIASYPKPYVALVHGYCLGGGLGVAVHGSHRVVAPSAQLAMPETAIGFFPDVGASHFLGVLPGALGLYLGLTGTRLGAGNAVAAGLATHAVGAQHPLGEIAEAIVEAQAIDPVLARYETLSPVETSAQDREAIERCFSAPTLAAVIERVTSEDSPWARATRDRLDAASPTSLALTFALIRQGRTLDLLTALRIEYLLAKELWRAADFLEGVRAMVVDKDRSPAWDPARIEDVAIAAIDARLAAATQSVRSNADAEDRVDVTVFDR